MVYFKRAEFWHRTGWRIVQVGAIRSRQKVFWQFWESGSTFSPCAYFIEHKSERSGMPQDTGVGRNVVLDGLDFASLRRVWEQTFGAAPPRSLSRVFMRRVLAYERQCRTLGWHSATTRRALAAMANGTPGNGAAAPAGSVSAGTHLVREWNGRTYQVEVLDNGYRFDGKTYPSLTAITKRITGTHWSGPRFFGLTPKRKV